MGSGVREQVGDVYWASMDLEKAYDGVDTDAMQNVLLHYGVSGNLLRTIHSLCVGSAGSDLTKWFPEKVGL